MAEKIQTGVNIARPFLFFVIAGQSLCVTAQNFDAGNRTHIRALEVLNDSTVWFAANRGTWGFTRDGGRSWTVDSIKVDNVSPQFRAVSVLNDSTALLLSIDSPAYLLKTVNRGKNWKLVHKDTRKGIFFDCMFFSDQKNGYAIGDPIDSCFQLIKTSDGGETWNQTPCSALPKAREGEACFAASNSNMAVHGKNIWFATGGKHARIFYSGDKGINFRSYPSPLPQGETMSGIYSLDFLDEKRGVIAGGHYERTDSSIISLAYTNDAGKSWTVVKTDRPFFGSCVRFITRDKIIVTGHNGTFIVELKTGKSKELKTDSGETLKFYTLRLTPDRKTVWLAGSGGRIHKLSLDQ